MRIAQVAPLAESIPPRTYGGIERVVHYLTEELVRTGHSVTLFASGDSQTSADLVSVVDRSFRTSETGDDVVIWLRRQLHQVVRRAHEFDVIHFHVDTSHFPFMQKVATPSLTTMHGRLDVLELQYELARFPEMPIVSISNAQRKPVPARPWMGTVYNGTPVNTYPFQPHPSDYFAFLGRFSPEKGPAEAIEIAKRAGVPLKLAAKVDAVDREYFETVIQPLLAHPLIEYIGEIDDTVKSRFLGGARALLFPIQWPEPFGLVMTEAMACGTPVIAFRNGSVDEVMCDGVSGFVVDSVDEAIVAAKKIDWIDRRGCRAYMETKFSVSQMTRGYLEIYQRLISPLLLAPPPKRVLNLP